MKPTIALRLAGTKGLNFLNDLQRVASIDTIVVRDTGAAGEPSARDLVDAARPFAALVLEDGEEGSRQLDADLIFVVGWQRLLQSPESGVVILHDSLLPAYRGFAPTVAALINGERRIGVTALLPDEQVDSGRILAQAGVHVETPLAIREAFELLRPCYLSCATTVIRSWDGALPVGADQDNSLATYSQWRDGADYWIDWSQTAHRIERFVHAVGHPYNGAMTGLGDIPLRVTKASVVADAKIVDRVPGKLWRLDRGVAEVVCGEGIIRLDEVRREDGTLFEFRRLRQRLCSRDELRLTQLRNLVERTNLD